MDKFYDYTTGRQSVNSASAAEEYYDVMEKHIKKEEEFSKRMKKVVDAYNDRDSKIDYTNEEVLDNVIDSLFEKGKQILEDIQKDAKEFEKLGITFEEKAFYDILKETSEKY